MKRVLLLVLAVVMVVAFAQIGHAAVSGKYVGLGVGQSKLDLSSEDAGDADKLDDTDTGIKIFGGAVINPNFAVEVGYIMMGEAVATYNDTPAVGQTSTITAESNSLYVAAVGVAPVDPAIDLYAKLGLHHWMTDFTVAGGASGSGDGTGTDLMYGFGAAYNVSPQIAVRLEFENYTNVGDGVTVTVAGLGTATMDGDDVSFIGIGAAYKF